MFKILSNIVSDDGKPDFQANGFDYEKVSRFLFIVIIILLIAIFILTLKYISTKEKLNKMQDENQDKKESEE